MSRRDGGVSSRVWILSTAALLGAAGLARAQDRSLFFDVDAPGEDKAIDLWGLDTAWLSEGNVRRGVEFMGKPQVDLIRFSFTPDSALEDGDLSAAAQAEFDARMAIVDNYTEEDTELYFNSDAADNGIASWFRLGDGTTDAYKWAQLIDVTRQKCEDAGRTVLSVAPFNEPDDGFLNQGTVTRLGDICWQLRFGDFSAAFSDIRLCSSALNCDNAYYWYDVYDFMDEGNTHQLAGTFDSYAAFYQSVIANGDVATNDELHNVMEAMVGIEYGVSVGIWWGTAEYTRGQFVQASDGERLGYAEHRPNWSAASVYRAPDGSVKGFVGASERQAVTTDFRFVSTARDVFFDGQGPQRAYIQQVPGGNGYWVDQPNAEKMVNITWGDDIEPVVGGRYFLVSRSSGKVVEVAGGGTENGTNIQQGNFTGTEAQQWDIQPVDSRIGGDFNYFTMTAAHNGKSTDIYNYSLDDGGDVRLWDAASGVNQQWVTEYVEDGYFRLRSRWSGLYLEVADRSADAGANVQQGVLDGEANQEWRLIPASAGAYDFEAPPAPASVVATPREVAIDLSWDPVIVADLAGYEVLRSETLGGPYEMIGRGVAGTTFTDGKVLEGHTYHYVVKAADHSLNRSVASAESSASPQGGETLVAHLPFDGDGSDASGNGHEGLIGGQGRFGRGHVGSGALIMDGETQVTLPATVASHDALTVAGWVWWSGGDDWQRIFDFGNGTESYFFLSPKAGDGNLRFEIQHGGVQHQLNTTVLPSGRWVHVAVTLGDTACIYVDGELSAESETLSVHPSDVNPVLNLIGDSQYDADPMFQGMLDDFRVYNQTLSAGEVAALSVTAPATSTGTVAFWNFEDGVAGQSFTPVGAVAQSGGSYDLVSGILMRGYSATYGPSWSADAPPNGDQLAMSAADNAQDGYVIDGPLVGWSPTEWTIECTVLLEEISDWKTLIGIDGSSQEDVSADFYLQKNGVNNRFRINFDTVGGQRWTLDGTPSVLANTWYALAVTSDGVTLKMWLDSGSGYQQVGSLDISAQSPAENALPGSPMAWLFGRGWYDGAQVNRIDGRMDNVRFTEGVLTVEQMIPLNPLTDPAEVWRSEHFGTTANLGNAADDADPDGDGVVNLLERAFGGDPNGADPTVLPVVNDGAERLSLEYPRSLAATDLTWTVEESATLEGDWVSAMGSEEILSSDGSVELVRFTRPADTASKLFLRLRVTAP
ncbi:LamG-like jellyroll fold domain-containing protein [Haloferula luteola]|nr:LamG-like jellyroll fold domain-containing protein [Haloferula luteola]